jgi:hypothetical protein
MDRLEAGLPGRGATFEVKGTPVNREAARSLTVAAGQPR